MNRRTVLGLLATSVAGAVSACTSPLKDAGALGGPGRNAGPTPGPGPSDGGVRIATETSSGSTPVGLGGCQPLRAQVRHRLTGQSGKPTANPVERLFEYLRSGGIAGVGGPGFSSRTGLGHPCTGPAPVLACVLVTRTTDPVVQFGDPILVELAIASRSVTMPTPRWWPRHSWRRWPRSWSAPTPARLAACVRAWPRP